jgi:hypothetical protein
MPRRRLACCLAVLIAATMLCTAIAGEAFPFGSELMLDTAPMRGSKRIPMIQIEETGLAVIDLWCTSLRAQATVGDASISIVPAPMGGDTPQLPCEPDRQARDADLLAALAQVTAWRRSGEVVELSGPTPLRFRRMTN